MSQHHVHLSKLHIGETRFSKAHVAPCRPGCVKRRLAPRLQARLTARGTSVGADKITLKKVLGEGSYGTVFEVRLQGSQPAAAKAAADGWRTQGLHAWLGCRACWIHQEARSVLCSSVSRPGCRWGHQTPCSNVDPQLTCCRQLMTVLGPACNLQQYGKRFFKGSL